MVPRHTEADARIAIDDRLRQAGWDPLDKMPPIASMEPVTDALLDRMVQAIVDEVDPEQVILFGSRGRGDESENSDVDPIVVAAEPFGPGRSRHKELVRLYHALAGFRVPADLLISR